MEYTFKDLKEKTVAQLKEIAKGIDHEALKGYTQLNKEHLLAAICTALGVEMHIHPEIKGVDKSKLKSKIRKLKSERDKAAEVHDYKKSKSLRRQVKRLKNKLRRATV